MLNLLLNWVLSALGLIVVSQVVPGFLVSGFGVALVAAVAIGFVNATIGLILKILTFPLTLVTLGLFWFVINALMLKIAAALVPGFSIDGFIPALLGAFALSLINLVVRSIRRELEEDPGNRRR